MISSGIFELISSSVSNLIKLYLFDSKIGNQYIINSSASRSFNPNNCNCSSKKFATSSPLIHQPSLIGFGLMFFPSQYKEYNFFWDFTSVRFPLGSAITFHPSSYFG